MKNLSGQQLRELQHVVKETVKEDGSLTLSAHETKLFLLWLEDAAEFVEQVERVQIGKCLWLHKNNNRHSYLWVVTEAPIKGGIPVVEVGPPHE